MLPTKRGAESAEWRTQNTDCHREPTRHGPPRRLLILLEALKCTKTERLRSEKY